MRGVGGDGGAEHADVVQRLALPVLAAPSVVQFVVEQQQEHVEPVGREPGRVAEQGLGHLVPVEQVQVPAEDDGRGVHDAQQPAGALRHAFRGAVRRGGRGPAGGAGQGEQMPAFGVVEAERAGQRVQDAVGRAYLPALFHPLVVVGAQPGQQRQFLAPQPGHLAPAARLETDVARGDPAATGAQEVAEFAGVRVRAAHTASVPPS